MTKAFAQVRSSLWEYFVTIDLVDRHPQIWDSLTELAKEILYLSFMKLISLPLIWKDMTK